MVRILHIVSSLNINAGMLSVVMNYYRHINRSNVQFDFLYFDNIANNYYDEIKLLDGNIYHIGPPSFSIPYQRKLDSFFSEHRGEYAAVHCHPIFAPEVYARAAKKSGIKHIIAHSHSSKFSDKKASAIRNYILNLFVGMNATEYMACSPEATMLFGKRRAQKGQVQILNNAIDCDRFSFSIVDRERIRTELHVSPEEILVGHVGRFSKEKNHVFLIESFKALHIAHPNSKLLLVGDGGLRQDIENMLAQNQLQNVVILTGKRSDIPALLSAMDVFVLPSLFEGAPVAAIEAQTSGLPCVMSDIITKSINISNCHYLSLSDPIDKWAEEINQCALTAIDRSAAGARVASAGFDICTEAAKLEKYYISLE